MWQGQTWQVMLGELRSTGMTLEQIGDQVGLGRSAICKMLKGSIMPSVASYGRIQAVYRKHQRRIRK